jgi:hypothetical protein
MVGGAKNAIDRMIVTLGCIVHPAFRGICASLCAWMRISVTSQNGSNATRLLCRPGFASDFGLHT